MQLPFFLQLVTWLSKQTNLKDVVKLDQIGVAGHSRGAKLAALHLASGKLPGLQHAAVTILLLWLSPVSLKYVFPIMIPTLPCGLHAFQDDNLQDTAPV